MFEAFERIWQGRPEVDSAALAERILALADDESRAGDELVVAQGAHLTRSS